MTPSERKSRNNPGRSFQPESLRLSLCLVVGRLALSRNALLTVAVLA
jgi:hypothetical protein